MRILYILDRMHHFAGMERILTSKMNYIADNTQHQVYFATYEQKDVPLPFPLSRNIVYQNIEASIAGRESLTFIQWISAYPKTRKVFSKKLEHLLDLVIPDMIICTTYSFNILDIILLSSKNRGIKTIVESHTKVSAVLLSSKYKYNPVLNCIMKIWDRILLKTMKEATCLVTLTRADAIYWNKYNCHVEVIPNMITIAPSRVVDYESKKVISVGRYSYEKGFDNLIKAWSLLAYKHPDWELYIYGNGDRNPFESLVETLELKESVFCLPATDDIASKYAQCSLYVMASRYEGFGLVLTEAMSCGLPCISFDCPYGPAEIINDAEDGCLVEKDNIDLLAAKMDELMCDSNLRKKTGMRAIQNVARYEEKNIMKKWMALLEALEV